MDGSISYDVNFIGRQSFADHISILLLFIFRCVCSELMTVMPERQDNQVISLRGLNSPASHFSNRSYPCDTAHPEKIGAVTVLHLGEHYLLDIFK